MRVSVLHVLATRHDVVNLLSLEYVLRRPQQGPVHVRVYATPEMTGSARRFADVVHAGNVHPVVVDLPHAPDGTRSGPPLRWRDLLATSLQALSGLPAEVDHVWAYAGATKPLSIAMWQLYAELRVTHPGRHEAIYPDQRERVWIASDREVPLDSRVSLEQLAGLAGLRLDRPTVLLTPKRSRPASLPVGPDAVDACRAALADDETLRAHLSALGARLGCDASKAFEHLVAARALPLLEAHPDVCWVYADANPTDAQHNPSGQQDLTWVTRHARVMSLDAKHSKAPVRDTWLAQQTRLRRLTGPYGHLGYVLPRFVGRPMHGHALPIVPFDAEDAFEQGLRDQLTRWTQETA